MAVMPDIYSNKLRVTNVFTLLDLGRMLSPYRPLNKINKESHQLRYADDKRPYQNKRIQVIHTSIISNTDALMCDILSNC